MTHRWSAPYRTANATDRACTKCGLVKRTRHEPDARPMHWTEFWNGGGPYNSGFDAIITNPPYGKGNRDAVRFAELALKRCDGMVALLLTAKFDFGKTRHHLFRDNPRFLAKINLVDRIQWFPGDSSGTEDHAWFVWGKRRDFPHPFIFYEGRQ